MNTASKGACLLLILTATVSNADVLDITHPSGATVNQFAANRLKQALAQHPQAKPLRLTLHCANNPDPDCNDGFSLEARRCLCHPRENERGLMYGMLELAAQLQQGRDLASIREKVVRAHFPFRAIKFNLPWYSYRKGEHLALHTETCRDLKFWEAFLDTMVDNKFNVLSLWNMHPYMYMVRPTNFPKASPFTEQEMAEWQAFWHGLFNMARQRGIDTYVVHWNIFLPEEFSRHYGGGETYEGARFIGDGVTSPAIEKYTRAIWTMRNEDFFVLRWAQPDFIREFIRLNSQPYTGGCFIGSECYIPAKDYITQDEHRHWDYAFQRQWLFYMVWGNLLFNPHTPDEHFARALEDRFPGVDGAELLRAWILASNCANRLGSFYRATWDATLYSEGFAKNGGKLITVDELIKQPVLDESLYLSIDETVAQEIQDPTRIDPITLADQLDADCQEALRLAAKNAGRSESPTLEIELNDIVCWTWHGRYFAQKLRGAVALARYRKDKNKPINRPPFRI